MKIITVTTKRSQKKRQQKAQKEQRKKHLKKLLKELKLKEFKNIQERKAHIQSIKTLSEQAPSLKSTAPTVADILLRLNLDEDSARQILEKLEKREKLINQAKKNYLIKLQELLNKIDDIDPAITEERGLYLPTLSASNKNDTMQAIATLEDQLTMLLNAMDSDCHISQEYCNDIIELIERYQDEVQGDINILQSN